MIKISQSLSLFILFLVLCIYIFCWHEHGYVSINASRKLSEAAAANKPSYFTEEGSSLDSTFIKTLSHSLDRSINSEQLLGVAQSSLPYPISIVFNQMSAPVHPDKHVVVTCALSDTYTPNDANRFLGSARRTGFTGDIVVGVLPTTKQAFVEKLLFYNATVFVVGISCEGKMREKCQLLNKSSQSKFTFPVSFIRYFFYHSIASKYSSKSLVFTTDFRDVIFQNNIFLQRQVQNLLVLQHTDTLMVFQEAVPNKVLNRDPQTFGLISQCYGLDGVRSIAHNPVSTSGLVLGHRNAIVMYAFLVIAQSNANQRIQLLQSSGLLPSDDALKSIYNTQLCMSFFGVDQAFHNVLLYQGILDKYMRVVTMPQGEGPVNNLGGFFGEKKLLRAYLQQWKILRGQSPYQYVYNWNGEISSVVHQLDRFKESELQPRLEDHIAALQHLKPNSTRNS